MMTPAKNPLSLQASPGLQLAARRPRWTGLRRQASQPSVIDDGGSRRHSTHHDNDDDRDDDDDDDDDSAGPIVVVGLGRSGRAAAKLAAVRGERVIGIDKNPGAKPIELGADLSELAHSQAIESRIGEDSHSDELFERAKTVILSPGVSLGEVHVAKVLAACPSKVVSEMSYAARQLPARFPVVAITGTNGKSTVTTFVQQLLIHAFSTEQSRGKVFAGGNLGTSLSELALSVAKGDRWDAAAVECSSYQLEHGVLPLRPISAAILNLTPDHLERHKTMQAYAQAKSRIFEACLSEAKQPAEASTGERRPLLVLPADGPRDLISAIDVALDHHDSGGYDLAYVGKFPGAVIRDSPESREVEIQMKGVSVVFDMSGFHPLGAHNLENAAAALLLTIGLLLPYDMAKRVPDLETAIPTLSPPAHRMEVVGESSNGVLFVNDSKATNVESVIVALNGIGRRSVVLFGGIAKRLREGQGGEGAFFGFDRLLPFLQDNQHIGVVCFGADGNAIREELVRAGYPCSSVFYVSGGMNAAIQKAREMAPSNSAILLSPGCASFDEFDNFVARGEKFVHIVKEYC